VLLKGDRQGLNALSAIVPVLGAVTDWNHASLETAVKNYCEQTGLGLGKVAQPIRVAVSGTAVSPPIFESLEFLGRDRTLARIARCVSLAS
jgi:glutamyl-tRNA synthetase